MRNMVVMVIGGVWPPTSQKKAEKGAESPSGVATSLATITAKMVVIDGLKIKISVR